MSLCAGHGSKRKRSTGDEGQTAKRQKTGARYVLIFHNCGNQHFFNSDELFSMIDVSYILFKDISKHDLCLVSF